MASRRVRILPALMSALALGACSSSDPRPPDAELETKRVACEFDRGAVPSETLGEEVPLGEDIPIDHFILLMMENRSFDHYFGTMAGVDGFPADASNPDAEGNPVAPFHATEYCIDDVAHSWESVHLEYNDGANDGFVIANDPNGARALGYLDETDIPFYRGLYGAFAMSDRHFSSVLSSTWTNRFYYMAGTSFGRTHNSSIPDGRLETFGDEPYVIQQALEKAGLDWRIYYNDLPWFFGGFSHFAFSRTSKAKKIEQFFAALDAGELPPVTWVDPPFFSGIEQGDDHPPANPQVGQAFMAQVVEAVMASPLWARTALIITYDEHGGFYDHVPPPEACPPDDFQAIDADGNPREQGFDRYGIRVPLVVVSPYARRGYVSHRVTDHTSILRLLEARFGLPALSARDANAWPLTDMFDFDAPPNLEPPALPEAEIDPDQFAACEETYFPTDM
jgi:phospholipase C